VAGSDLKTIVENLLGSSHQARTRMPQVAIVGTGFVGSTTAYVDVLTFAAWRWSGLPPSRIIGAGTVLDTFRLRWRLAARYGISSDHVHAYVIGEHGHSQVSVLSSARIAGGAAGRLLPTAAPFL